jgi:2-oxoglutarate dehydrogenase E2 component (dihydrolipoamide succinyltransferase)
MAQIEIKLPAMGEGITEATIIRRLVKNGETVEEEQAIVEIATDKVDSEVPSTVAGKIIKFLAEEGETIAIGSIIAIIETDSSNETLVEEAIVEKQIYIEKNNQEEFKNKAESEAVYHAKSRTSDGRFISPLVRSIAGAEGISMEQIEKIKGTGLDGRITKEDVKQLLKATEYETVTPNQLTSNERIASQETKIEAPKVNVNIAYESGNSTEIIEMDRMRRLISDHMVLSKQTSPHVTLFAEADVTAIVNWRNKYKNAFEQKEGKKLTYTPLFFEAVVNTLKENMGLNVSVDGYKIIRKKAINLGMATTLPDGNLIVPVIRNACEKSLMGIINSVNDLAERARINKLKPEEIRGGTFTITNLGTFGALSGTPIINQPEVAILSLGAIKKRPVVIETDLGDVIAVRHIIMLSITHDHRVVDGAMAGKFLFDLVQKLENYHQNMII